MNRMKTSQEKARAADLHNELVKFCRATKAALKARANGTLQYDSRRWPWFNCRVGLCANFDNYRAFIRGWDNEKWNTARSLKALGDFMEAARFVAGTFPFNKSPAHYAAESIRDGDHYKNHKRLTFINNWAAKKLKPVIWND